MRDGFAAAGTFQVIDPPSRVAFSWGWAPGAGEKVLAGPQDDSLLPAGTSSVSVTLRASGTGTLVHLEHADLPSTVLREAHRVAWRAYLARLVIAAGGGDPGADPHG
jgi:uncharacterized protein YndB with AHSA1/START domain